jgi:phage repressor protein C with HTH and peptisase S24 domain
LYGGLVSEDHELFAKEEFGARVRALTAGFATVAEAARFLGVKEQTLRNARAGKNNPQAPLLLALSRKLNVSMTFLLGLDDDSGLLPSDAGAATAPPRMVPRLDVGAAAGTGAVNPTAAGEERLAFPAWMLAKIAQPGAELRFLRAPGDGMEPTIADGALLLIDQRAAERELPKQTPRPKNDFDHPDIYVFLMGHDLHVKRLRVKPNGDVLIISDNHAHDPELLRGGDLEGFKIVGRVIWWDNRL